jgi:[CysO sulfur-carrier protein]-S-L-cysteine hydrolase
MSSDEVRAPRVRSSEDEPAASRSDDRVPEVDAWQQAADSGSEARAALERGGGAAVAPGASPGRERHAPARHEAGGASGLPAVLPAVLRDEIFDWCRGGLPNEACGLLAADRVAGDGGVPASFIGLRNAAASPFRYLIDPDEQLRVMLRMDDDDEVVWGIVHSHVASPAVPSATDIGLAFYPDALYLVCSLATEPPTLRAWSIRDGSVSEVPLQVT